MRARVTGRRTGRETARGIGRVTAVCVTTALCVLGLASGALAATSSQADDAAGVVADELDTRPTSKERQCLVKRMTSKAAIAEQVASADDLSALDEATQVEVFRIVTDCVPRVLVEQFAGEDMFDGVDVPSSELDCLAQGFGSLDASVLAATLGDTEFEELPTESQDEVVGLVFECMPISVGRVMLAEFAPSSNAAKLIDKQAKCVGRGFADAVGESGGVSVFAGEEPPAEVVGPMIKVIGSCTPDTLVAFLTKTFRDSGAPAKVAACVAKGIVRDDALLDEVIEAQTTDGAVPAGLEKLLAKC